LLLLFVVASPASASVHTLTLEQAVAIALEKNRDIAKAGEYAKYVQGKYVEERAAALPQLGLNGSIAALNDGGLPAATGGGITQYDTAAGVSLTQTVYSWGKIGAAIRAAEIGLKTSDEQLRMARQAAIRDVTAAFHNVLLEKELLRLASENLAQKQRHSEEAKKRFSAGVATDYDILAAEVAADNAMPGVIRGENQVRLARERLRFFLALEDEEVDASGTLDPLISQPVLFEDALKNALSSRPEIKDIAYRVGVYNELINIASADNKPRLDLKGGAGWHQLEFAGLRNDGPAWNIGLFLSFPFFDGMRTDGRVAQARSDLATREIEKQKLLDSIRLEVRTALNDVRESSEIFTALSGTVRQAERLLQMAEKGYELGVKIRLEVDDAQTNLLQAQINRAKAATDYLVARINLEWTMGKLGE
jgi:HAE1 family hydrophobic/amphiphilic exporter-1